MTSATTGGVGLLASSKAFFAYASLSAFIYSSDFNYYASSVINCYKLPTVPAPVPHLPVS